MNLFLFRRVTLNEPPGAGKQQLLRTNIWDWRCPGEQEHFSEKLNHSAKAKYTRIVKEKARAHGFDFCGISTARRLDEEEKNLETWLSKGFHGKMSYMENHFDKRLDPTKLVPGAKSVITLLYNYYPGPEDTGGQVLKVARYAYGHDYHFIIKKKLNAFFDAIRSEIGEVNGRVFVDSAPVMERQWAAKSGLGWLGKNTLLINKKYGSYFFIAEVISDMDLESDGPIRDYCGTCKRCLDACPTQAFAGPRLLDASKCISYLTIELKEEIPEVFGGKYNHWVFGCDICQEVCPWNRFAKKHTEPCFDKSEGVKELTENGRKEYLIGEFNRIFKDSPIKRTKLSGLTRNIRFLQEKSRESGINS
jgi:epoxyqueuosine reductase